MAIYKRLPASRITGPDDFISTMDRVLHLLFKFRIVLLLLVLGASAVGFAVLLTRQQAEKKLVAVNGELYQALQAPEKASALEALVRKHPANKAAALGSVWLIADYLAQSKWNEALTWIDAASPSLTGVFRSMMLWNKVQILWNQGKAEEAMAVLDSLINADKEDPLSDYFEFAKAEVLWSQGKIPEALAIYDRLAHASEDAAPGLVGMAKERYVYLKSLDGTL